jgi:hypothetical protein
LESLIKYLGCGHYYPASGGGESGTFNVTLMSDITGKIIPFFDAYPLQGAKSLDYADFRKAADIIQAKGHLTEDGLDQIIKIKNGTNKGRLS